MALHDVSAPSLLREFLSEDGAIFISIDDNEHHHIRSVLDEIFGRCNFITSICWQKIYTVKNSAQYMSEMHDYIIVYARARNNWKRNLRPRTEDTDKDYTNPDDDPDGSWISHALQSRNFYSKGNYPIQCPGGRRIDGPPDGTYWRVAEKKFWNLDKEEKVWWGLKKNNAPRIKEYLKDVKQGVVPTTWWTYQFAGANSTAKTRLREILGGKSFFNTPKPVELISRILELATNDTSLILDSFAGSGTTGHAVLKKNKDDGGSRKFILVEIEKDVAEEVTVERLRRVIEGYDRPENGGNTEAIEGLGGGFRFCRLGKALFDEFGDVAAEVTFSDLAAHVFFSETGVPIPSKGREGETYLGAHQGKAVYLLFSQHSMGAPRVASGNVLIPETMAGLTQPPVGFAGVRIVFAEGCTVSTERLKAEGIVFKQIPYQVEGS